MQRAESPSPSLSAVVVHWHNEAELARLLAAWPRNGPWELVVVDNSSSLGPLPDWVRYEDPGANLGFAGGANRGIEISAGDKILLLNPDARPQDDAMARLLEGFEHYPEAAGIVPALAHPDGASQHRWQLRPLPSSLGLLCQTLLLPGVQRPREPPAAGTPIPQPAAAALALRRESLEAIGGLDEGFYPAWFEDVDLARRLADAGQQLLYYPAARFVHEQGMSVPPLGYGPFLWIYYRNLVRYLERHHGIVWGLAARLTLCAGMLARLALLPLRKPGKAASRGDAARGLWTTLAGAVSGWRRPRRLRLRHGTPP